ncbi:ATP-binding protein [Streptomyces sp. NBC_01803]|uniref:ATP-binding protein n=1 Tax=Streptomyces sp. NBC_01803 TaxID=2975946 RepID=UPI002DDA9783|nr:ATP-binding protein [Streptomyces sp. NBC_01803]WSA45672.1 ATP-binding protein [Streptomyces sp. NBC_01803]
MCTLPAAALAGKPVTDFTLTFPPEPRWVRSARDAVRTALTPVVPDGSGVVETAALLTSEVVTNAVAAALGCLSGAPVELYAEWTPSGTVRVLVHDDAPGDLRLPCGVPDPESEHGRGLLLLSLYATEWGVCHHVPGRGKTVWFTLEGWA